MPEQRRFERSDPSILKSPEEILDEADIRPGSSVWVYPRNATRAEVWIYQGLVDDGHGNRVAKVTKQHGEETLTDHIPAGRLSRWAQEEGNPPPGERIFRDDLPGQKDLKKELRKG